MRLRIILLAAIIAAGLLALMLPRGGGGVLVDERFEDLVSGAPMKLSVRVEGIGPDGFIGREYTCDGENRIPRVTVQGVPAGASSIALIVYDPDAPYGTFIHWLAIAPANTTVELPGEAKAHGRNDFGSIGYGGPCPPRGHGAHRYFFLAVAVDKDLDLKNGFTLEDLLREARGHVVAYGYSVGKYSR